MKNRALSCLVVVAGLALSASCTTFNNARPIKAGTDAVSATVGGPLTNVPGLATIPLPNLTVEGRHGLSPLFTRPLDVNYGVHLLPLAFGVTGAHVGATMLVLDEDGAIPALSVGQRYFFFTNLFDGRKTRKDGFLMSQTDLTASYLVFDQLIYGGASCYLPLDAGARSLRFAPVLGVELHAPRDWGLSWLALQAETRWLAPDVDQRFAVVDWVGIPAFGGDRGAVALNVGVAVDLSSLFAADSEVKQ